MSKLYIADRFNLSMLDPLWQMAPIARTPRPVQDPKGFVRARGVRNQGDRTRSIVDQVLFIVDDMNTCLLFSKLLGFPLKIGRPDLFLLPDDILLVGQYAGPRLPKTATELPEGAYIDWWSI